MNIVIIFSVLLFSASVGYAWDSEQLEVFDAVDEVNQNFYELLNISKVSIKIPLHALFEVKYCRMQRRRKLNPPSERSLSNYILTKTKMWTLQNNSVI